jgi:hypothetical protein
MKVQRLLLSVIALVAMTATAWADISKWIPEVIDGEPTEKVKNPPPQIRVRLFGEPMPAPDVWGTYMLSHAKDDMKNPPPGVKPTRAIPYHKSNETLGIVLLIEGHEYYFGNDVYKQAQDCKDPAIIASGQPCKIVKVAAGVFTVISGALEAPGAKDDEIPTTISRAGPPGSKGVMIVYSAGPEKRYDGDLKNLTADKLGDQRAQEGKTSRTFIEGLQAAQQALTKIGTNRKALFIFSDGFDVADATEEITAIKKKLDADKVEVFAFYLEATTDFIPDDANTIKASKTKLDILSGGRVAKAKDQDALKIAITAGGDRDQQPVLAGVPGPDHRRQDQAQGRLQVGRQRALADAQARRRRPDRQPQQPGRGRADAPGARAQVGPVRRREQLVAVDRDPGRRAVARHHRGVPRQEEAGAGSRAGDGGGPGRGSAPGGVGAAQREQDDDGEHLERRRPAGRGLDRADPG